MDEGTPSPYRKVGVFYITSW